MSIILRNVKGSPLTYNELDGNFVFLSQSYATTGSNAFSGDQTIVGNLSVFGTASFTYTTSSITTISASTFGVSISNPSIRYGFYDVYDVGVYKRTSSLAWDSTNQYWIYQNVTGSVTSSAIVLTGPKSTSGLGSETTLTQYYVPVSNGDQSLSNSIIFSSGSSATINGSVWTTNNVIVGGTTSSNGPGFGRILAISGSYPGIVLDNSVVNKTYYFGNGAYGQFFISDDTTGSYRFIIESNGRIGLGKAPNDFLDVNGNTIISGSLNVTTGITGSLTGTSSYASFALTASHATNVPATASYALQALSSSFTTTASYVLNAVSASYTLNAVSSSFATTASYVLNAVSASRAVSASFSTNTLTLNNTASSTFATRLANDFVGAQNINGNVNITGSLIRSGSSLFRNIGLAEMTGSLLMNTLDGRRLFRASSSLSSSISSSNEPTTASFNGTGSLNTTLGSYLWDSNFDVYYSGVSGSGETELSPVFTASADSSSYNDFTFGFSSKPQITLSPSGSIQSYKIYIYDSGSSNSGPRWYVKSAINSNTLENGINVLLSGPTSANFGTDLENTAGFNSTSDPTSNVNTITYVSQSSLTFTSSLVEVSAPFTVTGSVGVSGSTIIRGDTTVTGSLNLTGSFFVNGQKQFNYISLFHTASILPTQNVSGSFIYSTVVTSSGISVVNNSRITFANTGVYNIQFSAQLYSGNASTTVDIWFKRNGVNIANSATKIGPVGNATYHVPAWNFIDTFTSGSYVEIAYQTDQTNTQFQYAAASGNIPAIPSIMATITQVA